MQKKYYSGITKYSSVSISEGVKIGIPVGYKRCSPTAIHGCGKVKPFSAFNKKKGCKDGLSTVCRECDHLRDNLNRIRNRERNLKIRESGNWDEHIKEQFPSGKVRCQASGCKEEYPIDFYTIRMATHSGLSGWCKCCIAYNDAKPRHKKRSPDQEMITYEEYKKLYFGECHEGKYRSHTANGVDRIDSSKGYVRGNVVSMCFFHNQMKMDVSREKYIELATDIVESERMREEKPRNWKAYE
tara:strand:+ start:723 stop:1448 length:726 start_codon:yes stop_codon:yes gene_type:complete